MRYLGHPFRTAADVEAMIDLLLVGRAAGRFDLWPTIAQLRVICTAPAAGWTVWLWVDDRERPIAFALLDATYGSLHWFVRPGLEADADLQIIGWAQEQRRAANPHDPVLRCMIRAEDRARIARVERLGLVREPHATVRLSRPLAEPIPAPRLPAGFTIRPVTGEQEVAAYVALHREAMGTSGMTIEHRLAIMRDPAYMPDLDLVAVAPDGTLAAYCFCSINAEENARSGRAEGWTDPLGTRPGFQRQGLARALLLEGMGRLRAQEVATAIAGTGSWNVAARRAFASVGYREIFHIVRYCWRAP